MATDFAYKGAPFLILFHWDFVPLKVMLVRLKQSEKTSSPMASTLSGITIFVRLEQLENA